MERDQQIPAFVLMIGMAAAAMAVPAFVAAIEADWTPARAYLQGGLLLAVLAVLVGIVTRRDRDSDSPRAQLLTLLGAFSVLPVLLAVPHHQALGQGSLGEAALDMVSAMTTTGAPVYDHWHSIPRAAQVWRAEVAWLGGFLTWVAAAAILAPMNMGGFEVRAPIDDRNLGHSTPQIRRMASSAGRLGRFAAQLAPIYGGLTAALWVGLLIAGDDELIALCHAMSIMSTSGISPVGGPGGAGSGIAGEAIMLLFFVFALTRSSFARTYLGHSHGALRRDPEIRLALLLIGLTTALLFLHHWASPREWQDGGNSFAAFWGTLFTAASFLTTTGFESASWDHAVRWSGFGSTGLALIGLAVIGGGVATTAGGVKLMRIFALGIHLRGEVRLLVEPRAVPGDGAGMRRIREQGAFIAWMMFMLFAISIAVVMILLSLNGVQFETAMVLAVAALSNCGPLSLSAGEIPVAFTHVPPFSQTVLACAMIAGRVESLALIALANTDFWRS